MSERIYNLGSPEIQEFFGINDKTLDPIERRKFTNKLIDRFSETNIPERYKNAFIQQGILPDEIKALNNYIEFQPGWKNNNAIEAINKLTNIAHNNPNQIYSYNLNESPLYRGAKINPNSIPKTGQEFSFDRFRSFTPDIFTAISFAKGDKPIDWSQPQTAKDRDPSKIKTLFQIQQEPSAKYNYLITPGAEEPEVLSRPDARYIIEKQQIFPFNQRGMSGEANLIKLRQIYGLDPIGTAVQGGVNLAKENISGTVFGAALSALNPKVAQDIEKNQYKEALNTVAKDITTGALAEAGIKKTIPIAGKFAPNLVGVIAPAARLAGPIATGAALFGQGQTGSLTDVLARKASNIIPGLKANPKTDIGRRAGNEFQYIFNQLRKGKIPYSQ